MAVIANVPDPLQAVTPSVAVAVIVALYPLPAGMPPTVTEIVWLLLTSTVPARANAFGPVIE